MIVLFKPTEKYIDYLSKKILQEMTKKMSTKGTAFTSCTLLYDLNTDIRC